MNKAIENLEKLKDKSSPTGIGYDDWNNLFKDIEKELERLKTIDNADPSGALECLKRIREFFLHRTREMSFQDLRDIEQYILKSQELETMANEYNLQPSQIREALLVFCMMQGAGYKLSDIEKAQKQEKVLDEAIKLIVKVEEELDCKDEILDIIKEKCLYNYNLNYVATCINYDMYKEKMREICGKTIEKLNWDDKVLLDYLKLFTQEEFDTLKRWVR